MIESTPTTTTSFCTCETNSDSRWVAGHEVRRVDRGQVRGQLWEQRFVSAYGKAAVEAPGGTMQSNPIV